MTTSGTTAFNLDFSEIAEEAWERAGKEMRSGYDLRTARRSMNLLTIEWQNRGINMWTIDQGSIPLIAGTDTYTLPTDTIDLLEHVIRTNAGISGSQADISLSRISVSTYGTLPNKTAPGRPLQIYVQRLAAAPQVTLWPIPDQGTAFNPVYTLVYWRMRRIQDAGNGIETPDVQFRFLPALIAGIAYHLAIKDPALMMRVPMLKAMYDEAFETAASEDREKAATRFVPRQMYIG